MPVEEPVSAWLALFYAADRDTMEACYRDNLSTVGSAVGRILSGADKETVVQEVFFRVLSDREMRLSFRGGSIGAWLSTVGRNSAVDYYRRRNRDAPVDEAGIEDAAAQHRITEATEARLVIEQFVRDHLPPKWSGVFEQRFLRQLNQREAAAALGISRTTLAYQELRVRSLLKKFLVDTET